LSRVSALPSKQFVFLILEEIKLFQARVSSRYTLISFEQMQKIKDPLDDFVDQLEPNATQNAGRASVVLGFSKSQLYGWARLYCPISEYVLRNFSPITLLGIMTCQYFWAKFCQRNLLVVLLMEGGETGPVVWRMLFVFAFVQILTLHS
jgi:hypothetical protein